MDGIIYANTIPAWFVALNMILAGIMLRLSYYRNLRTNSTLSIAGTTMLVESLVYGIAYQTFAIDAETRGFISRFVVISLCMSLYLPLLVSYMRSRKREH